MRRAEAVRCVPHSLGSRRGHQDRLQISSHVFVLPAAQLATAQRPGGVDQHVDHGDAPFRCGAAPELLVDIMPTRQRIQLTVSAFALPGSPPRIPSGNPGFGRSPTMAGHAMGAHPSHSRTL